MKSSNILMLFAPAVLITLLAIAFLLSPGSPEPGSPEPPSPLTEHDNICEGCGAVWRCIVPLNGDLPEIKSCPECPLSEDDWLEIQRQLRTDVLPPGEINRI